MQKANSKLWMRFVPLLIVLALAIAACGGNGNGPDPDNNAPTVTITPDSFVGNLPEDATGGDTGGGTGGEDTGGSLGTAQAEPLTEEFTAVGEDADNDPLTYTWSADEGVTLSATSGETVTATFTEEGTFNISVEASDGTDTGSDSVTATIAGPDDPEPEPDPDPDPDPTGGSDMDAPTGTFGVSTSQTGPFENDDPLISDANDDRIIDVAPGGTFYAQVTYSDPSGISAIEIALVNSDPSDLAGPLPAGGFSVVGEPTGDDCDLSGSATEIVCVYQIDVAADTQPITELDGSDDEFAYVFRTRVTDGANNQSDSRSAGSRGYVNIEAASSN